MIDGSRMCARRDERQVIGRRTIIGLVVSCAALLVGCDSLTQLVVVSDTDLRVPDEIDRIVLEIDREAGGIPIGMATRASIDLTSNTRPGTIALVHEGGPRNALIRAEGMRGTTVVVRRVVRTSWIDGQSRVVRVDLLRRCINDPACSEPELVEPMPWNGTIPAPLTPSSPDDAGPPPDGDIDMGGPDVVVPPPPPDAGVDAGCDLLQPPPMPMVPDGPSIEAIWFAVEAAQLVSPPEEPRIGYDLDDRCSLPELGDPPPLDCEPTNALITPFDGARGVDNSLNGFLAFLDGAVMGLFASPLNESITASFQNGLIGLLFRVSDWNGTPDDPDVSAAIAEAAFGTVTGDGIRWYGSDESFDRTVANPLNTDVRAYVTGGVLVARMRDGAEITLNNGMQALRFDLNRMIVTGRISRTGPNTGRIDEGVISARWPVDRAIAALTGLGIPPVAPCTEERALAETAIRNNLDLRSDPAEMPETDTCDAISVGIGFRAIESEVIGIQPPDDILNACVLR